MGYSAQSGCVDLREIDTSSIVIGGKKAYCPWAQLQEGRKMQCESFWKFSSDCLYFIS